MDGKDQGKWRIGLLATERSNNEGCGGGIGPRSPNRKPPGIRMKDREIEKER